MKKERVMVTGAAGFIGSHVADLLCENGYNVCGLDLSQDKDFCFTQSCSRFFFCDIRSQNKLKSCFSSFRPEYVIHCAALARIQPSFENPKDYYETNVMGTLNLLELSKEFGVEKFVYSASSSAYGRNLEMPLREDMPPRPLNPYADSKWMGEILVARYARTFGLPGFSLRYFNVYGPREPQEGQYATVIGIFLRQLKKGEPLTIVPDGNQKRDFTWVGDVARANLLALKSLKNGLGEVINIGYGSSYSILELADMIVGQDYPIIFINPRPGEAKETLADIARAEQLLGWEPEIDLETGLTILKREMGL